MTPPTIGSEPNANSPASQGSSTDQRTSPRAKTTRLAASNSPTPFAPIAHARPPSTHGRRRPPIPTADPMSDAGRDVEPDRDAAVDGLPAYCQGLDGPARGHRCRHCGLGTRRFPSRR